MDKLLSMSKREIGRLEVLQRLAEKRMKQRAAAEQLGVSVRHVKRLLRNYRQAGAAGVSFEAPRASEQQPAEQRSSQTGGGIGPGALPRPAAGAGCGLRSDAGP